MSTWLSTKWTSNNILLKLILQSLADQIGVGVPGDDPLAALELIGQRCRVLSAKCHHEPTSATEPMTAPQQLGATSLETTELRDDDDLSHVVKVNELKLCSLSVIDLLQNCKTR